MQFLYFFCLMTCFDVTIGSCYRQTDITQDLLDMLKKMTNGKPNVDSKSRPVFFASLTTRPTAVKINEIVKFDDVRVNRVNGYQPSTGIFTAPMSGLYAFNAILYAETGNKFGYQLNKNDRMYVNGYTSDANYGSQTTSVIIELKKGDQVYIKHRHRNTENIAGHQYSYFSGYFLHE
ncbi:complement C1q-like protein 3 [Mytilus californianus]|uniref:complement C1q-like protein 3 n=1 Tax=Mytilus californianus TaxID=6549 RepID=UPI002246F54A|nr:complement C1q-like protein 3 [Mytilus californianus]